MNCPGCDRPNQPDRRYCGGCGASLRANCPSCAFGNEPADRFCGGCGAPLAATAEARRAPPAPLADGHPEPARAGGGGLLSANEVGALLRERDAPPAPAPLPARVTQEDLDRLFGAKP